MSAKKNAFIAIIFIFLVNAFSCSHSDNIDSLEAIASDEHHALLFIDEKKHEIERHYYKALIDFQHNNDEKTAVTIIQENEPKFEDYEVEEFPTLILITEDQSVTVISGEHSSDQLLNLLRENFNEQ